MIPGEYFLKDEPLQANTGRETTLLTVMNTGDRPVQIGSHFHFFEVNKQLVFDRVRAFGKRLNIPAGTAVRFEPGEEKRIELVPFGGNRRIFGFSNLTNGDLNSEMVKQSAIQKANDHGFKTKTV